MATAGRAPGTEAVPRKYVVYLENEKERLCVKPGVSTIGRGKECDIVLKDLEVSRLHAHFRLTRPKHGSGSLKFRRASDRSKTLINGKKIGHENPLRLRKGDKLTMGAQTYTVTWRRRLPPIAGDLYKQSPSFHHKWQRRHVLVKHGNLMYFNPPYVRGQSRPVGNIPLSDVTRVHDGEAKLTKEQLERSSTFFLEVRGRTYAFRASNATDRKKWTAYLRERIEEAPTFPAVDVMRKSERKRRSKVKDDDRVNAIHTSETLRPGRQAMPPKPAKHRDDSASSSVDDEYDGSGDAEPVDAPDVDNSEENDDDESGGSVEEDAADSFDDKKAGRSKGDDGSSTAHDDSSEEEKGSSKEDEEGSEE